jgi:hypothetical protein
VYGAFTRGFPATPMPATGGDWGDGFRLAGMHDGDLQATMSMTPSCVVVDDNPGFAATASSLLGAGGDYRARYGGQRPKRCG